MAACARELKNEKATPCFENDAHSPTLPSGVLDLNGFLGLTQSGMQKVVQLESGHPGASPTAFPRVTNPVGRTEGSLTGRDAFPIERYLDPHSHGILRPRFPWPRSEGKKLDAFLVEFRPALPEWPLTAAIGDRVTSESRITAFEFDGIPFAYGNCRRTIDVTGFESIVAGGNSYSNALRMEAETVLSFGWLANIRVYEKVWFGSGVGPIRRSDKFQGRALWLFRFYSANEYELQETVSDPANTVEPRSLNGSHSTPMNDDSSNTSSDRMPGMISHAAVCFERTGRNIRMSGLAVEWELRNRPVHPAALAP